MSIFCAVARIAYLASDVVLSVQPSLRTDSQFSKSLNSLKAKGASGLISKAAPEVSFSLELDLVHAIP